MRIKICGIMQPEQGEAIAHLGADALGFICVAASPRYVTPAQIQAIAQTIPPDIERIGVFVNAALGEIGHGVTVGKLTGVQLHGDESPEFCRQLRQVYPSVTIWKAVRVRSPETLTTLSAYLPRVDALLLDAYHPHLYGGTGHTLDWGSLQTFAPPCPWWLAGGLTPENVTTAIAQLRPDGVDVSSGVERSPGDKDLDRVRQLIQAVRHGSRRDDSP
ncbi:phosphoribosylanthranilate isomerase [Spirulina major]|uniref:phosphoribosylanthranilate isomerase n=1 Tax=Spirulina major TaxID=270636 RepID=UPI000933D48E